MWRSFHASGLFVLPYLFIAGLSGKTLELRQVMNDAPPNLLHLNISARWFFLPPFIALFTVAITALFSSDTSIPVDDAIWGLVGLLFVILTVLYGIFIRKNFSKGLFSVQLIAQGLLLCPLSLRFGARMFQWLGVTMAICGAVVLVVVYYRSHTALTNLASVMAPFALDRLPSPCVLTDGEGNILSISDALLRLTQQPRMTAIGGKITLFLPLDKEIMDMGGKKWQIFQVPMRDGTYYFQLEEIRDTASTPPLRVEGESALVDAATSLYTRPYAVKRVEEELYRIRRYQRWMSAVLLRMVFQGNNMPGKEDAIFNAYCKFIRSNTRAADISCLAGPRDILVVLPETQLDKAEEMVGRLVDFVPHIQEQLADFDGAAEIQERVAFWGSPSEDTLFNQILEKLDKTSET
jgi:GGDEF domain-containing protein